MLNRLAIAKRSSAKSYSQIASETGLTNVYVAQLFKRQAQLSQDAAVKLRQAVPHLTDELINEMMLTPPLRAYRPTLIQDPAVYRFCLLLISHGLVVSLCFGFESFLLLQIE